MKKKILFAISITTLLIASCKKNNADTPAAPIEVKFSAEALAYVQLPLYKYFIYKDSATAALDSVVVTQSNLERILMPKYDCGNQQWCWNIPAYYYQNFSLSLTKFTATSQELWFTGSATSQPFSTFLIAASDTSVLYFSGTFFYPLVSNYQGIYTSENFLGSFIVEGKTYNNVLQFINVNTLNTSDPIYKRTNYYWAKSIGIIKREVTTGSAVKTDLLVRNG